jgi:FtsH-binding integral membrane protein
MHAMKAIAVRGGSEQPNAEARTVEPEWPEDPIGPPPMGFWNAPASTAFGPSQKRPTGLTVMAVFNLLRGLSMALAEGLELERRTRFSGDGFDLTGFALCFGALSGVIGFVSGIGYLRRKRLSGRHAGNVYALTQIAILPLILMFSRAPSAWSVIVTIVYAILTLVLLNGIYKNEFSR